MTPRDSRRTFLAVMLAGLASACGGGGGGSMSTPPASSPGTVATLVFYGNCSGPASTPTIQYTIGIAAPTIKPCRTQSMKDWTISPALPAGLTFDGGDIAGTPTAILAPTNYVVSFVNAGGSHSSVQLTIGVSANVLLDLGHAAAISFIKFDAAHVLSQDNSGHWVLWNYTTLAQIANGNSATSVSQITQTNQLDPVALAGPTVVIGTPAGLEVRTSATGAVLAEIPVKLQLSWWRVAPDGSYVCGGTVSDLTCWSPAGQQLFSQSGNYSNAVAFATPGELLVALGAAGPDVIETVSSAGWTSTVGPAFQGKFHAWFVDGSAFLTTTAVTSTVSVYSIGSILEDSRSLPSLVGLTGQGNWFWTNPGQVTIYAVGNSALPTATFSVASPTPIGTFIVSLGAGGPAGLTIIDLSGAQPVETSYNVPVLSGLSAYALNSPSQFMVGVAGGVLIDESTPGTPRTFDYGAVTNLVGGTARAVFTTASGATFSYETATKALNHSIDLATSQELALSSDGGVLAALETGTAASTVTVNIYSMPSGAVLNSFSYSTAGAYPISFNLSGGGTELGETMSDGTSQIVAIAGGATTAFALQGPVVLSPDGTLAAVSNQSLSNFLENSALDVPTSSIYKNGTLLAAPSGYPAGWLDNGRLLTNNYNYCGPGPEMNNYCYIGANIFSPTGAVLATSPVPEIDSFQSVTSDLVYAMTEVISITTGAVTWESADPSAANTFAGSAIVLESGNLVVAQPY